ncbi:formate--tetrahydrofolate ligase [Vescimonas sp.]|uniref:formate--tetrahydrofolate ligase n=1 Tax=Vescimonas sp. TaxID=2892404 RepID=UPI00307B6C99
MRSDIEIAQSTTLLPIDRVARKLGLGEEDLERNGQYMAKLRLPREKRKQRGKLILVTAINPTQAGEGKTTTSIGLADAMNRLGAKTVLALREPSLGPVFGLKGGATGGGMAQIVPMEEINLHFTGDFHAIGAANNLLAAMVDNHIYQGNELGIDRVVWRRCVDMNDRQLRSVLSGVGGGTNGVPRAEHFDITVASEVMAVFCLAEDLSDLKARLGRMIVGYTREGKPVTAHDLKAEGAMTALLKRAILPNLVQTLEGNPAIVHGGPFANIAHGCNSIAATRAALALGDYCVTEAGFGADLGAEKFLDIKCRMAGLAPDAAVVVATVRALKLHGGATGDLSRENPEALKRGLPNLRRHVENLRQVYGLPVVVALNEFATDTPAETALVREMCRSIGAETVCSRVWEQGSAGGVELAEKVIALTRQPRNFRFAYRADSTVEEKLLALTEKIYGGAEVRFTPQARRELEELEGLGFGELPVCVAKTQYSLSDDPKKTGAPEGFAVTVRSLRVSAGAGFVVALTGDVMTMPGLPKHPAAENIDITGDGRITGLF